MQDKPGSNNSDCASCSACKCPCNSKAGVSRLSFIGWMAAGWAAFAGALALFATMIARFLAPNVDYEPSQSFHVGSPDLYSPGEVATQWKGKYGIWIVHLEDRIIALSTNCTHLGCTPNWLESEGKFKCPCHGSGFRRTGVNFEGPAPRPLERFKISLDPDGKLLVDKSVKFRAERGQWEDPESFVAV